MQSLISRFNLKRRWPWVAGGVALIAIVAFFFTRGMGPRVAPQTANEIVTVTTGDLSGSISGSGHLQPRQSVSLSMAADGIVQSVNVQVGEQVKAGETLLKLDDTDAKTTLAQAELAVQENELNVTQAQYDYDNSNRWVPNQYQVTAAEASLANAAAEVKAAQAAYDLVAWMPGVSATGQSLNLESATNSYNVAKAELDQVHNNRPDVVGPANDLAVAQVQLQDAQLSLDSAKAALERTTLVAPFDGTITAINVEPGETTSGVVIEIATMNHLEVVLEIDEIDIGSLDVSQPASVTLETFPDAVLTGKVVSISPTAIESSDSDVVQYEVRVSLDASDLPLRAGMTANAQITTFNLSGVMLVPNSAIIPDRETGKYYVNRISGQGVEKVEITIGGHNDVFTQVLSGLQEGDTVQTNTLLPIEDFGPGGGGPQIRRVGG